MKALYIAVSFLVVQWVFADDLPKPTRYSAGVPVFVVPTETYQPARKLEVIVPVATANALRSQADAKFAQRQVVYVTQRVPSGHVAWEAPGRQEATWYVPPAQDAPMSQQTPVSSQAVAYVQPDYSTASTYYTTYPYYGYRYSYRYPYYGSYAYSYSYPYYGGYSYSRPYYGGSSFHYSAGFRASVVVGGGGHSSGHHGHRR